MDDSATLASRFESLARMSKVLAEAKLDTSQVLEGAAKEISATLGGSCVIRLVDEREQLLRPAATFHSNPEAAALMRAVLQEAPVSLKEGAPSITGWSERPVLMQHVDLEKLKASAPPAYREFLDRFPPTSLAWLPMKVHGRLVGLIVASPDASRPPLGQADIPFLQEIADRAALAVATSLLHEGLQRELEQRKVADEALRRSEERFRKLAEHGKDILILRGRDLAFLYVSRSIESVLGYAPEEFKNLDPATLGHPDDAPRSRDRMAQVFAGPGKTVVTEQRVRHKNGTWRWLEGVVVNMLDDPSVGALVFHFRDVTDRRAAEEDLRRSEEMFSTVFRSSPAAIAISTMDEGRFIDVNEAMVGFFGYAREELVGQRSIDLGLYVRPTDRQEILNLLSKGQRVHAFGSRLRTKGGAIREAEIAAEPLIIGGERRLVVIITDLTERRAFERMRDDILDVVSHEFRTPVTVIQGYADILSKGVWKPGDQNYTNARHRIEQSSRHLGFLLGSVTELASLKAGQTPVAMADIPSIELLKEAVQVLEWQDPRLRRECRISVERGAETTRGDRRKLVISLAQLLHNAAKFSPQERPVWLLAGTRGDRRVLLVEDEGPGIPTSIVQNIGKPFFQEDSSSTRKLPGAGLGLALVLGLTQLQGGTLEFSQRPGGGTRAAITLPLQV